MGVVPIVNENDTVSVSVSIMLVAIDISELVNYSPTLLV